MLLSRSLSRKLVATLLAVVGFVLLYEVTIIDSQHAARQAALREQTAEPAAGVRLQFTATAYCKGEVTASGVAPRTGIAAADPNLLPVGSVTGHLRRRAVRRHLHHHGHRPDGQGEGARHLHVELL
jgi:hypothetical protein